MAAPEPTPEVRDPSGRKPGPTPSRKEAEAAARADRVIDLHDGRVTSAQVDRTDLPDRTETSEPTRPATRAEARALRTQAIDIVVPPARA